MWLFLIFAAIWLGVLIYEFSTRRLVGWKRTPWFKKEPEPNGQVFWAMYAIHVFGFLVLAGYLVSEFYFKDR
jgi:hypothetical protein